MFANRPDAQRAGLIARWPGRRADGGDDGFTMIEMIVALAIIGIIMSALGTFFVTTVSLTAHQGSSQVASQLADDGLELANALKGSQVVNGRDQASANTQWAAPVVGVAPYLTDMTEVYDPAAAAGAGATANLPTTGKTVTVNNLTYTQNWYIGTCWQAQGGGSCLQPPSAGASMTIAASQATTSGYVGYFRVVVAVSWNDKSCINSACSKITATLVSNANSEPVFNTNASAQAPTVVNPGNQAGDTGVAVSLQLNSSGGSGQITWTGTGLPAGLSISQGGLITGSPTTPGTYTVTVAGTDAFGLSGTAAFTWTVNAAPQIAAIATQTDAVSEAALLQATSTGGTGTLVWAATGLPAGLTLDTSSGRITGTPTTATTYSVSLSATDSSGQASTMAFSWVINAKISITTPGTQSSFVGIAITPLSVVSAGGAGGNAWTATGLPTSLSINASTGQITGTPSAAATYTVKVTVTDADSGTASTSNFTWKVAVPATITNPTANQSSTVNKAIVSITATATGGTAPYTWTTTGTGLPTGISITSAGVISGTPTVAGTYAVTLTITDSVGQTDTQSLSWVVNPVPTVTNPTTATRSSTMGKAIVSFTATATGGTGALTWKTTGTGLPAGISITSAGVVSGTPTAAGTSAVTLTVTDSLGVTGTVSFSWVVNAAVNITNPVTAKSSDKNVTIAPLTATATGGTGAITWSATNLPTGLSINTTTGVISGTPSTTTGSPFSTVITATDSLGATDTQAVTWTIVATTPTIATIATQTTTHNTAATTVTATATGGSTPYTWSISGQPTGITINAATGAMTGTPTTVGTYTVTVTVTDAGNAVATKTFTWRVT